MLPLGLLGRAGLRAAAGGLRAARGGLGGLRTSAAAAAPAGQRVKSFDVSGERRPSAQRGMAPR